jgi:hypothetical protein
MKRRICQKNLRMCQQGMRLGWPNCYPPDRSNLACSSSLCNLSYQSKDSSILEDTTKVHLWSRLLIRLSNSQLEQELVLRILKDNKIQVDKSSTDWDQFYLSCHRHKFQLDMVNLGLVHRLGSSSLAHKSNHLKYLLSHKKYLRHKIRSHPQFDRRGPTV